MNARRTRGSAEKRKGKGKKLARKSARAASSPKGEETFLIEYQRVMGPLPGKEPRHDEPSKASLEEMPEIDFEKAVVLGRGPEALKKGVDWLRRGRPKKGEEAKGTSIRSLRLPDQVWERLDEKAAKRGISTHALLREAVARALS